MNDLLVDSSYSFISFTLFDAPDIFWFFTVIAIVETFVLKPKRGRDLRRNPLVALGNSRVQRFAIGARRHAAGEL